MDPVPVQKFEVSIDPRQVLPILGKSLDTQVYQILLEPYATIARESDVLVDLKRTERGGAHSLYDHETEPWGLGVPLDKLDKEVSTTLEPTVVEIWKDYIQILWSLSYQTVHVTL